MVNEIQWIIYKCQKVDEGIKAMLMWIMAFNEILIDSKNVWYLCMIITHELYGFAIGVFINLMVYIALSVNKVGAKDSSLCIESISNINWPIRAIWFSRNGLLTNCRTQLNSSKNCQTKKVFFLPMPLSFVNPQT